MTCDELREEMELHALGLSAEPERSEIFEHLGRGCEACRGSLNRAISFNAALLAGTDGDAPTGTLRKRLLASVGSEESNWGWVAGWGLVVAGLAIAVIWLGMQDRAHVQQLAEARQLVAQRTADVQRVRNALDILNLPETKQVVFGAGQPQPPKGRVFVHAARGVLLLASNLPPLGADRTYQFWIIPKGAAPRPAGLFQADASGTALHFAEGRLEFDPSAVAVSVEPASGSPAPTTTPIIMAPLAE